MIFRIKGEWLIEVDNEMQALTILGRIENEAAKNNCDLENSSVETEDEEDDEE